jgi:hypothetical protein
MTTPVTIDDEVPANDPRFELITCGKGGHFTNVDIDHVSALIEQDDLARFGDREFGPSLPRSGSGK